MDSTTHTTTTVEFVDWRAKGKLHIVFRGRFLLLFCRLFRIRFLFCFGRRLCCVNWCRLLRNIGGCLFRFDGGRSLHLSFRRRCASQFDVHAERNLGIRKVKLHGAAVGFEVGQNFACVVDNSGATFGERALRVADDLCEPRLLVYKAKQCPQNITLHALCGTTALEQLVLSFQLCFCLDGWL